jgi:S-adenosylmethionine:tRNA ribosyltransferase-isomerase
MKLNEFDFELPNELIARYPLENRTDSRLLCLNKTSGDVVHRQFSDLLNVLSPKDLLVFNNTKVIPARWFGIKASGGKVEILLERMLEENHFLAHVKASKSPKPGSSLILDGNIHVDVISRQGALFELACLDERAVFDLLESYGHVPLPPYMERGDTAFDKDRYQTVYAKHKGAVAAPTAGLHFDEPLLEKIKAMGVDNAFLTLHVGAGTFQPVREEIIDNHQMHAEYIEVSAEVRDKVQAAKARGGRVIAVGTTSVRSLESASQSGEIEAFQGESTLFIYPGYKYRCVDAMITNFHLPKSSLLMLLCAFAGYEQTMYAYQTAINEKYRFYSYGDAMWVA